jgi:hypothetical protein
LEADPKCRIKSSFSKLCPLYCLKSMLACIGRNTFLGLYPNSLNRVWFRLARLGFP